MQFIDLKLQQKQIRIELQEAIHAVLDHGKYIMGPEVFKIEETLANFVGVKHAVSCSSGTDALLMALMAMNIGPGDAIFTTPFTFIATAEVISLLGATPIFIDIDPKTYNIDYEKLEQTILSLNKNKKDCCLPRSVKISDIKPRGIISVDLFGLPADYDKIKKIAEKFNLFIIEDAAQSFGATYKDKQTCSLTEVGCTSFFPAKPLGCYGDGGMCFTDNDKLLNKMQSIRIHGKGENKYDNIRVGINGRFDTIQAAILLVKFGVFQNEIKQRQEKATIYTNLLKGNTSLVIPHVPENYTSVWAQYSLLARNEEQRLIIQNK